MPKLYIHAGNHKTGTSSIQAYLFRNAEWFFDNGFLCFLEDDNGVPRRGNHSWWFDYSNIRTKGAYLKDGFFKSIENSAIGGYDVVVSSECFSWIFDREHLKSIAKKLKNSFDSIEVIFYFRRQDQHAVSHYQQAAKSFAENKFYSGGNGALPDLDSNAIKYLDYYNKVLLWEDAFGSGTVIVRKFSKEISKSGVLQDFLYCLGIPVFDTPKETGRANESWGWEKTKVFRILNELGVRHQSELGASIKKKLSDDCKLLPSAHDAKKFHDFFIDSNSNLARKLGMMKGESFFDDDFSFYPSDTVEDFDEVTASQALENLAKGFLDYIEKVGNR
jgi:hypothetical protein